LGKEHPRKFKPMSKLSQHTSAQKGSDLALRVEDLHVRHGDTEAVRGVSFEMTHGEVRVVLGANGAGKTSILKAIMGMVMPSGGTIEFPIGEEIQGLPAYEVASRGVSIVPEGRALFSKMTVEENLLMGAFSRKDPKQISIDVKRMLDRFQGLARRRNVRSGLLSGGEQQMLAVARALMAEPSLLLMDEPSLGLAPRVIESVYELIREINSQGMNILLVEQNVPNALRVASYGYVLELGKFVLQGTASELLANRKIQEVYLGG
jgi:branched-chain amino acid transport system ATP-binding protein